MLAGTCRDRLRALFCVICYYALLLFRCRSYPISCHKINRFAFSAQGNSLLSLLIFLSHLLSRPSHAHTLSMYKVPTSQVLEVFVANGAANTDEKDLASSGGRNPSTTIPKDHRRLSDLSVPSLDDDETDRCGDIDEEMASINGNMPVVPLPLSPRRITRAVKSMVKSSGRHVRVVSKQNEGMARPDSKQLNPMIFPPVHINRITQLGTTFAVPNEQKLKGKIRSHSLMDFSFIGSPTKRSRRKRRANIPERRLNQSSHI